MKYIILGIVFVGLMTTQFVYVYAFETRQKVKLPISYTHPTTGQPVSYDKKITIVTPRSTTEKLPVVIMLHGDLVDEKCLNVLKREFISSGYMVVLVPLSFTFQSYIELNFTLNMLLTHPNVDTTKIGLVGHSHGGHFSFWFAKLRNDVIRSVVMANMGSLSRLYEDYYSYYNYFVNTTQDISYSEYMDDYSDLITPDNPKNLLIITDVYQPVRENSTINDNIQLWTQYLENAEFSGYFENGTARELNTKYNLFSHGSGLYNPKTIAKQIEWTNNALGISPDTIQSRPIAIRVFGLFGLLVALIVVGVFLMYYALKSLPIQLSWVKNRIYKIKRQRSQNAELKIPAILEIPKITKNKKDIHRIEKRYVGEYTYLHDLSEYLRIIVLIVIGVYFSLYFLELLLGSNALFYAYGNEARALTVIRTLNTELNDVIFIHPLSFNVMYFWILLVFFIRRIRIKDPKLERPPMNVLDIPNILIVGVAVFGIFWVFGFTTIYHWLGFNFLQSGLNITMRFAVIFYMHFVIVEFIYNQASQPDAFDRHVYIKAAAFILLIYLPITIPSITVFLRLYDYAMYYIIPYLIITVTMIWFSLFWKLDAFIMSIGTFFLLLFWKYNVYYMILF